MKEKLSKRTIENFVRYGVAERVPYERARQRLKEMRGTNRWIIFAYANGGRFTSCALFLDKEFKKFFVIDCFPESNIYTLEKYLNKNYEAE